MSAPSRDRGAVIVEAAIAITAIAVLLVGVIEYGFAWRQQTVVEKTVQQAARTAGNLADQPEADYEVLQAFRSQFASAQNMVIDYIVIYKSESADGQVPPACRTSSRGGVCNRYVASDLNRPASQFGCGGTKPDEPWCPTRRDRTRNPSADYVGVFAQVRYTGITGMLPNGLTINRSAVYALEPCAFGLPGC